MRASTATVFLVFALLAAGCDDGGSAGDDDDDVAGGGPDAALGGGADGGAGPGVADAGTDVPRPDGGGPSGVTFTRHTVDGDAAGPAYVTVTDLDGDGALDLVVTHLGVIGGFTLPNGELTLHQRTGGLGDWSKTTIVSDADGIRFPGHTTIADLDGDDDLDIVLPSGFLVCTAMPGGTPCGGLRWLEQSGADWIHHDIVATGAPLFYHHAELVDIDGDDIADLVTTGEEKAPAFGDGSDRALTQWFRGTGDSAGFETTAHEVGAGLGSFPNVLDVDGDGDLDIAGAEFFTGNSFGWFERTASGWSHHVIDDQKGPSIMMRFVPDLYGDGVLRALGSNHSNTAKSPPDPWESAIYVYDVPADPTQAWSSTKISTGIVSTPGSIFAPMAAPGIFGTGDMDNDGDIDIVVSGDGDPNVYWLEQLGAGSFATHVLQADLPQAGGAVVVDLDGDGKNETIVTGYENNVVYIFEAN